MRNISASYTLGDVNCKTSNMLPRLVRRDIGGSPMRAINII
jgi:hypothetical protein